MVPDIIHSLNAHPQTCTGSRESHVKVQGPDMLVLVLCHGVEMTLGMFYGSQLQKTTSWSIFPSPQRAMDISQARFSCTSSDQFLPRKLYFSHLTIKVEMENFTSYMSTFGHRNPIKDTVFRMQLNFPETKKLFDISFQTPSCLLEQWWTCVQCSRLPQMVVDILFDLYEGLKVAEEFLGTTNGYSIQKCYF